METVMTSDKARDLAERLSTFFATQTVVRGGCDPVIEEAIEFIRSAAPPEWLPIETVPKDGTRVLLAWKDGANLRGKPMRKNFVAEAYWSERIGLFRGPGSGSVHESFFSHWMPLPAAPNQPA